jgi:hypothetical protein
MFAPSLRRSTTAALAMVVLLLLAAVGASAPVHTRGNPNPGVVPNKGHKYGDLSVKCWLWALSFSAEDVPFFNTGGPVDISAGQSRHVWGSLSATGSCSRPCPRVSTPCTSELLVWARTSPTT